jgi:hypothetical protein
VKSQVRLHQDAERARFTVMLEIAVLDASVMDRHFLRAPREGCSLLLCRRALSSRAPSGAPATRHYEPTPRSPQARLALIKLLENRAAAALLQAPREARPLALSSTGAWSDAVELTLLTEA